MITDVYHSVETSNYNAPAICIGDIGSISFPSNLPMDSGAPGPVIYMHLTTSTGPDSEQVNEVSTLPIMPDDGLIYGGQAATHPAQVQPKKVLEGHIDTPCAQSGEYFVSQVIDSNGIRYMYPEILAMMIEGRANIQSDGTWGRSGIWWYRDPYGRLYYFPRIIAFTGTYVVGVPERVQFTMTLKLTKL